MINYLLIIAADQLQILKEQLIGGFIKNLKNFAPTSGLK